MLENSKEFKEEEKNKRGILNSAASHIRAVDLYDGRFYRRARQSLYDILDGKYPFVHLLIVSALYGLVKLDEGIKEYDLEMGDRLDDGMKVSKYWQENQLWPILEAYIEDNDIFYIWSLLPNQYHCVFDELWTKLANSARCCFHIKFQNSGQGITYRRADWLVRILNENPKYLVGDPLPPQHFEAVSRETRSNSDFITTRTGRFNMPPTAQDFQNELERIFELAQKEGKAFVDVSSGDLHRKVGGYPGRNHRMPVCCNIMRHYKKPEDQIISAPPRGLGASFTIRYLLPR